MAEVIGVIEVNKILNLRKTLGCKKVLFIEELSRLKQFEGLAIKKKEWPMKTSPASYYYQKNKKGLTNVRCLTTEEGYLLVKKK
jgi:hypothetical protein